MPQVGLQLYTVRRETAADFTGTLKAVADTGYQGVEFAGYGSLKAPELAELLSTLGLTAISAHVSFDRLTTALDQELDYLGLLGARRVVCPSLPEALRGTEKAWLDVADRLAEVGERCSERGFALAYHNHAFEFTGKVAGKPALDAMLERAEKLDVELDVGWCKDAGYSPVEYIRRYAGRLPLLHIKDIAYEAGALLTVPLGQGVVELREVIAAAEAAGVAWLVVEQDECREPALDSIRVSREYLKSTAGL